MGLRAVQPLDADVERVFAVLCDHGFLLEKFAALGHEDGEVLETVAVGDGYRIRTRRVVEIPLPSIAKKVLSPRNTIEQVDDWEAPTDRGRRGTWVTSTKGAPVELRGEVKLTANESGGCTYEVTGELKVKVPLVGGKIAGALSGDAQREMDADVTFLAKYLADHMG
jgi:hypothetical protein